MANINPILTMVSELNASQSAAVAQQAQMAAQVTEAQAQQEAAGKAALDQAQLSDKIALQAKEKAQNAAIAVSNNMGGQVGTPEDIISILAQDFRQNELAALQSRKQVVAMENQGIDNPLKWLVAQLGMDQVIDKHNTYAEAANASEGAIQQINAATTATAQAQQATAKILTPASIEASLESKMQEGLAALSKVKYENLRVNMQDINMLQAGKHQMLQNAQVALSAQMQADAAARADRAYALQVEEFNWRKQKTKEAEANAVAGTDKEFEANYQILNTGLGVYGKPPVTSKEALKTMLANPQLRAALTPYMLAGQEMLMTGRVNYGSDPGNTLNNLASAQVNPATVLNKDLFAVLNSVGKKANIAANPEYMAAGSKDRAAVGAKLLTEAVVAEQSLWLQDSEAKGSLHAALPLSSVIAHVPPIKNTVLYAAVLEPLLKTGVDKADFNTINSSVDAAIKAGVLTENLAAKELANFYTSVIGANNVQYKYDSIGMLPQTSYTISPEFTPYGIGALSFKNKRHLYDVTKPEQVLKYRLARNVVNAPANIFGEYSISNGQSVK